MRDNDKIKFKELLVAISQTYDRELTASKARLWWNLFKQYSITDFESAVYAHMSDADSGMFEPKPACIIRHITGTSKQNQQSIEDRANMAWSCVEREIGRIGSYGTLELEDKIALAAVKGIGGWKALCGSTMDQLVWKKKEFVSNYKSYENSNLDMLPSKLPGLIELSEQKIQSSNALQNIHNGLAQFNQRAVQ